MTRTRALASAPRSVWVRLSLGSLAISAALFLNSITAFAATTADLTIAVDGERITMAATDVPLQSVLNTLAEHCNLRLIQEETIERPVNVEAQDLTLAELLDELLGTADSYQLFLPPADFATDESSGVPGTLWVFSAATGHPFAIDFLETVLLRGNLGERKQAIRTLRNDGSPAAVQALSFALSDSDPRARRAAVAALSKIGSDEALAALASMATPEDPRQRAAVAQAMASTGGASAQAYLDAALKDDDPMVRMAAAESLGDLGDETSRRRIQAALEDPDPAVRERAIEILEDMDDEAMYRALFQQK